MQKKRKIQVRQVTTDFIRGKDQGSSYLCDMRQFSVFKWLRSVELPMISTYCFLFFFFKIHKDHPIEKRKEMFEELKVQILIREHLKMPRLQEKGICFLGKWFWLFRLWFGILMFLTTQITSFFTNTSPDYHTIIEGVRSVPKKIQKSEILKSHL
jgi:hypothetical protein